MKKKTKCYIYTRVSTAIQVDGYSLDAQKDKLRKYAEFQDMEIVGEYSDEGHSGKNIKGCQIYHCGRSKPIWGKGYGASGYIWKRTEPFLLFANITITAFNFAVLPILPTSAYQPPSFLRGCAGTATVRERKATPYPNAPQKTVFTSVL